MIKSDIVLVFQNSNTSTEFTASFVVPNNVAVLSAVAGSNSFLVTPDGSLTLNQLIVNKAFNGQAPFEVICYLGGGGPVELNFPVIPGKTLFVVMFGDTTAFLHFSLASAEAT